MGNRDFQWWATTFLGWLGAGLTAAGYAVGGGVGVALSAAGAGICAALGSCFPAGPVELKPRVRRR